MYLTRTTLLSDNSSHGFDVFCGCKPHPFLIRHPHLYRGADAAAAAAKIKTKLDNNALVAKHFFPLQLYCILWIKQMPISERNVLAMLRLKIQCITHHC